MKRAISFALVVLVVGLVVYKIRAQEQEVSRLQRAVSQQKEVRSQICDRVELMFGGADDVARRRPYTAEARTRIQTDLAIFAPVAEGCVVIPPATNRALNALDNDQALQEGALELGRALAAAKARRWPL